MKCISHGKFIFTKAFVLLYLLWIRPIRNYSLTKTDANSLTQFSDVVHTYLMEFGYLPKSDIETGNLRTEHQLKEAIKKLQAFGNIPETGEIDEPTRKLLRTPRCGLPDQIDAVDFLPNNRGRRRRLKRFVIQGPKWHHTNLTWSLVNQTMSTLDAGQVRRVLTEALNAWSKHSKLTFREIYSEEADIQVLFARRHHGDGYDFDGPGQVLAHAFYPGVGRGGDAHFDEEENWFLNGTHSSEGTNLMGVAVHEFGHSLGLGHSSVEEAIMFPWYHGYEINKELPQDDRIAIEQIYGSKEKQWGPLRPSFRYTTPSTTSTTTTTTTTTTQKPILRFYPDKPSYNPRDRETTKHYPEKPLPRRPFKNDPQYPPNHPRYNEPKYPPRNPNYYPDSPRYPKTPFSNPRYPHKHPHHNPKKDTTNYPTKNPRFTQPTRHHRYPYTQSTTNYPRTTETPKSTKPDTCNTNYDAISMIRGELFIFKDRYLWRIGEQGLRAGYPHEILRLWSQLPNNLSHVDAVYENRDRKIIFFIGHEYYVFNTTTLERGYPKPLTHLGLPSFLKKIDAALVWGHNNKTYFYSETLYWRFDEDIGKVELDYPRDMSIWQGINYHIDSAFQYLNGKTYFFKGKGYWEFDDSRMHVVHDRPKLSAPKWMKCSRARYENEEPTGRRNYLTSDLPLISTSQRLNTLKILRTDLVVVLVLFCYCFRILI